MPSTQSIVILWDLQNTPCKKGNYPIQEVKHFFQRSGSIKIYYKVFHDFKGTRDPAFKNFENAGFETYLVSTDTRNNADRRIIESARNLHSNITTLVLITSDGDFTPLVKELQQAGKKVWVIYKNKLNHKLRLAADRCIPWSDLKSGNASAPVSSKPPFLKKQAKQKPQKRQPQLP